LKGPGVVEVLTRQKNIPLLKHEETTFSGSGAGLLRRGVNHGAGGEHHESSDTNDIRDGGV
jgi:hypothetical protein